LSFILSKSVSSANFLFAATQIKAQQLAHHDRQKKAAHAQIKVKEREISEQEGELLRLRGSLEPLKSLWCALQIHWSYPHVAYTVQRVPLSSSFTGLKPSSPFQVLARWSC
jgi:hypothetical protein